LTRLVAGLDDVAVIDLNCIEGIEVFEEQGRKFWDKGIA